MTIEGLHPYTRYVFRVAVETPYNSRLGIDAQPGPSAIFKTQAKGMTKQFIYTLPLMI